MSHGAGEEDVCTGPGLLFIYLLIYLYVAYVSSIKESRCTHTHMHTALAGHTQGSAYLH